MIEHAILLDKCRLRCHTQYENRLLATQSGRLTPAKSAKSGELAQESRAELLYLGWNQELTLHTNQVAPFH